MERLFGKKLTSEDILRKNQRTLNKAIRDIEREKVKMEQQEKKIISDIRKMAKQGQIDAVKIIARDLLRNRKYVKKFTLLKANMQAIQFRMQSLRSQHSMVESMKDVAKAMHAMNNRLQFQPIQRILQEFQKQSDIMDMKEELVNEAINNGIEADDDADEESDAIVQQVLDEFGLQVNDTLRDLPLPSGSLDANDQKGTAVASKTATPSKSAVSVDGRKSNSSSIIDADADLQARLDKLRRS